jgi:hypothetical protein
MAKSKTVRVTEEEAQALAAFRESYKVGSDGVVTEAKKTLVSESQQALADAFVAAIERTRPPEKKTVANRKPNTPWHPASAGERPKLKRKMYHHGRIINESLFDKEIELLNKVRPGVYCEDLFALRFARIVV